MIDPYARLALAVIQQAVYDMRHGLPGHRRTTRSDIKSGCLDYWVDIICVKPRAYHYIKDHLRKLAEQG